jgi:hypothetical protein
MFITVAILKSWCRGNEFAPQFVDDRKVLIIRFNSILISLEIRYLFSDWFVPS